VGVAEWQATLKLLRHDGLCPPCIFETCYVHKYTSTW
jgi:hypothetical protein